MTWMQTVYLGIVLALMSLQIALGTGRLVNAIDRNTEAVRACAPESP